MFRAGFEPLAAYNAGTIPKVGPRGIFLLADPMQLTPSIFKAYDIRGVVPSTLNEAVAEALGKAFGTRALAEGETTVAVGRDGRLSGPALSAALIRGLVAAGVQVIDIGMATTPMLYFAANTALGIGATII